MADIIANQATRNAPSDNTSPPLMESMPPMPPPEPCMSLAIRTDHHQPTPASARRTTEIPTRSGAPPDRVKLPLPTVVSRTPLTPVRPWASQQYASKAAYARPRRQTRGSALYLVVCPVLTITTLRDQPMDRTTGDT